MNLRCCRATIHLNFLCCNSTNWCPAIFIGIGIFFFFSTNMFEMCPHICFFAVDSNQLHVADHLPRRIMPICLTILIERLREIPNFLCNCRCEIDLANVFIRPQTSIGVRSLVEILCEHPEFLCYCTGCQTISNEDDVLLRKKHY